MRSIYKLNSPHSPFQLPQWGQAVLGNTAAGVFTRHNFTNYTQSSFGSLLVTNSYGIIGGRDTESDTDYQYRIHLKLISQSGINEAALRYQLLQLPGIQDVVFVSSAGSFYVLPVRDLAGRSGVAPAAREHHALDDRGLPDSGDRAHAGPDRHQPLDDLELRRRHLAGRPGGSALSSAGAAAANYINNLSIGQPLIINQVAAQILGADSRISDVGQPNDEIAHIFIWPVEQRRPCFRVSDERFADPIET